MTVIAYSARHRIMAADSRITDGDMHFSTATKLCRLPSGALFGFSGDADVRELVHLLARARPDRMPSRRQLAALEGENVVIVAFSGGAVFTVETGFRANDKWYGEVFQVEDQIIAVGAGAAFAYGAMEMGADPIRAVEVACKRSTLCARPVRAEKLRPCVSPTRSR